MVCTIQLGLCILRVGLFLAESVLYICKYCLIKICKLVHCFNLAKELNSFDRLRLVERQKLACFYSFNLAD